MLTRADVERLFPQPQVPELQNAAARIIEWQAEEFRERNRQAMQALVEALTPPGVRLDLAALLGRIERPAVDLILPRRRY